MPSLDFTFYAGDTPILEFEITGENVNIVGSEIHWSLAASPTGDALVSKEIGSGITIIDATYFEVTLLPADTEGLDGFYYHEAESVGGGIVSTLASGWGRILPTVIDPDPVP